MLTKQSKQLTAHAINIHEAIIHEDDMRGVCDLHFIPEQVNRAIGHLIGRTVIHPESGHKLKQYQVFDDNFTNFCKRFIPNISSHALRHSMYQALNEDKLGIKIGTLSGAAAERFTSILADGDIELAKNILNIASIKVGGNLSRVTAPLVQEAYDYYYHNTPSEDLISTIEDTGPTPEKLNELIRRLTKIHFKMSNGLYCEDEDEDDEDEDEDEVSIPAHSGHRFRCKPATHSDFIRPLIPEHSGHPLTGGY